jgi:hypothetical protein
MREIWKRKHFRRFWSIKVKKTAKSQFSLLGTVPDGVKALHMTASRVTKEVDVENTCRSREFLCIGDDGVTQGRHGPSISDGPAENPT